MSFDTLISCASIAALLVACKREPEVQTVARACEVRASWEHRSRRECTNCLALAVTPKCGDCNVHPQAGSCAQEERARDADATCKDPERCTRDCDRTDCVCIERCYAQSDSCEKLVAAVDACSTAACDEYCR